MRYMIREYVESLFADAPKTAGASDLKEEIIGNLEEKYDDLTAGGMSAEEALESVKSNIGNVDELIAGLKGPEDTDEKEERERKGRKAAGLNAVAIALYILSPALLIALALMNEPGIGIIVMIACIAAATGIKVYGNSVYPKYKKSDDSMVEDFKEWQSEKQMKKEKKNSYSSLLWSIIVVVYLVVSFTTFAWHITWLIFPIGAIVEKIISIALKK
ncbi:MAG: hypothetical protein IJH51_04630 [Christensenellaceae bacterium]|nr:hypothetical protein [Christensenellaceae bacterium]